MTFARRSARFSSSSRKKETTMADIGAAVRRVMARLQGRPVRLEPGDEAVEREGLLYQKQQAEEELRRRVREEMESGDGLAKLRREGQRMLEQREREPAPPPRKRRRRKPAAPAPEPPPKQRGFLDKLVDGD